MKAVIDMTSRNANVMQMKVFNARLEDADMERFAQKARQRGTSLTALLRQWIRETYEPAEAIDSGLDRYAATWTEDPEFDRAVGSFRGIDPDLWK